MTQIKPHDGTRTFEQRFLALRRRLADGLKWWAEHQSWPATDEIRVDRHRSACG